MSNYQHIVSKVNYWLFLIVVFLLPFPQTFLRYACVVWVVSWLLEGRWMCKPLSIRENKMAIPFILFGLWYAWKALSFFWSPDANAWGWQMERYLTFGLVIPIGIWGVNAHYDWKQAGKTLVYGCIAAVIFYLLVMWTLFRNPEMVKNYSFGDEWNYTITEWWAFFVDNISHIKHRLFLCSTALLSMIMSVQIWKNKKWMLAVIMPILFTPILLTGSRQSILTGAILATVAIICTMPKRYRLRYGAGIFIMGILIGGGILCMHPRMQQFDLSDITDLRSVSYDHDIRFNIWGSALQQPTDYFWHGLGAGQSGHYLVEQYERIGFDYYAFKQYHPHNQYLEELMELGIFGLLLFVIAWLSISYCSNERGRNTAILFSTLFMLNMCTDCMFGKFCGIALWAVGLIFILLQSNAQCDQQTTRDTQAH